MDKRGFAPDNFRVLLFLLLVGLTSSHPVVIGDPAPTIPMASVGQDPIALPEAQVTVVSFFATWCRPCHAAIADLLAIKAAHDDFALVLIAVGEPPAKVAEFVATRGYPRNVRVALDRTGELARAWGQDRFPTSFILDGQKRIRHINRGYGSGFRVRMDRWIASTVDLPGP